MDMNLVPSGQTLADGRPIFSAARASTRRSTTSTCSSRSRESTYNAFTATLTKRMTHGWMRRRPTRWPAAWTTRRSPAPTSSAAATIASRIPRTSIATRASRRSTRRTRLSVSAVVAPQVSGDGLRADAAQQQPGRHHPAGEQRPAVQHPLERRSEQGRREQRPAGRHRAQRRPAWHGSRISTCATRVSCRFAARWRGELFFEAKNLFNVRELSAREPRRDDRRASACPPPRFRSTFPGTSGYDQRQMQLGLKFSF